MAKYTFLDLENLDVDLLSDRDGTDVLFLFACVPRAHAIFFCCSPLDGVCRRRGREQRGPKGFVMFGFLLPTTVLFTHHSFFLVLFLVVFFCRGCRFSCLYA